MFDGEHNAQLIGLPQEIQILILNGLELRELLRLTETCRGLRDIVRHTPALRYSIDLIACGMRDNPHSGKAIAQRLNNLQRHDHAWRTLRWLNNCHIQLPSGGRVDNQQGVVLITKNPAHLESGQEVYQLAASSRNVPQLHWEIEPWYGTDVENKEDREIYEVDASQDLLIIRRGTEPTNTFFDVYMLSNGLPHPLAALPSFRISNTIGGRGHTASRAGAFIRGHCVYLLDREIEIYNWKLGERIMEYSKRSVLDEGAFISNRHLAMLRVGIGHSQAVLVIHELPDVDPLILPRYPPNIPVLAFFMPEINDGQTTETEWRLVGGSAHSAAANARMSGGDFTTDPNDTLILIPFRIKELDYELIVPAKRLLDFLPNPASTSMNAYMYALRELAWCEWGPRNVRVRRTNALDNDVDKAKLQTSLFGMRRVHHHPVHADSGDLMICVEDYDPMRVRRAAFASNSSQSVHQGDVALGDWPEDNTLVTELPYVVTLKPLPESWQSKDPKHVDISINEDGIMLSTQDDGERIIEACTF